MRIDVWGWMHDATRGDHKAYLALWETVERLGFAGVWFNEFHFQSPPEPYPSTLLLAAAIFARTERLRVGTAVLVLPLHEPLLLAEEIAQLDFQSYGRLDVGLGRGTEPEALIRLGIDPQASRVRFEHDYATLIEAWTGGGQKTALAPTVQQPYPPLYIAGSTRETLAFAAQRNLPLLLSLEPPETQQLATYRGILREMKFADALARSSMGRHVVIAATQEQAASLAEELIVKLHERKLARAAARGTEGMLPEHPDVKKALAEQFVWGNPAQCHRQIFALSATGVGQLRCVFNGAGLLDNATAVEAMRLFSAEVLPGL